jgi:integrase
VASVNWRKRGKRYLVYWRLDDGSQGGKTVRTKDEALLLVAEKRLEIARGTWTAQQKGKRPFGEWGDTWWDLWSSNPDLSPNTIETTRIQYRKHVRPFFERQQVRAISPTLVRRWQNRLQATTGWQTVMASRSILFRVLELAEDEGAIPSNPVRKVPAPKRPIDPEVILGTAKRRAPTPEEAGILLAFFPDFWWDHVITLLGTGMRFGELAGLRRRRVDRSRRCVQVVATRYQAGQAGSGFKNRPKSEAGIRELPLPHQIHDAIGRRLSPGSDPEDLVFTGPGGGPGRRGDAGAKPGSGVPRGTRTMLSRHNFRRLYQRAVQRARETAERPALKHLSLGHLDLHGPHDLRHAYSTWLEEEGIPVRVIDELMGHSSTRRPGAGAAIGRVYRETTPEMAARVVTALERRLDVVLKVAHHTRKKLAEANNEVNC